MSWWTRLRQGARLERELDAELRYHVERLTQDYLREGLLGGRGPTPRAARVRRPRSDEGGVSRRARYPLGRRPRSGFDVFRATAGQGPSVHSGCRACARARHRRQQHALHDRQRVVHPRSLDPACRTDGLRRVERGRAHAWPCLPGARRDPIRVAKPRRDFRVHHRPRDAGRARSRAGSRDGELCFTGDDPSGSRPTDARPRLSRRKTIAEAHRRWP